MLLVGALQPSEGSTVRRMTAGLQFLGSKEDTPREGSNSLCELLLGGQEGEGQAPPCVFGDPQITIDLDKSQCRG
jgi:hypothetical protein